MPSNFIHKTKASKNFCVYDFLDNSSNNFYDWESVILFYSSLHLVDAFFSNLPDPIHPRNHKYRNKMVSRHLGPYASDYLYAHKISRLARYSNFPITANMKESCLECYKKLDKII
jgi:hypothetical protein